MKDMPADIPPGLCIGAGSAARKPGMSGIPQRQTPLPGFPAGARIGTSSLRRAAQLRCADPTLRSCPCGAIWTPVCSKLRKPRRILMRLFWPPPASRSVGQKRSHRVSRQLGTRLPAVGQGALCIEIRQNDANGRRSFGFLNHPPTRLAVAGERSFSIGWKGSCQVPIAAHGGNFGRQIRLEGLVADIDGRSIIRDRRDGPADNAEAIGRELADRLLGLGADDILKKLADYEQ